MSYYHPCPLCGANLDPGENCDCDVSEPGRVLRVYTPDGTVRVRLTGSLPEIVDAKTLYEQQPSLAVGWIN